MIPTGGRFQRWSDLLLITDPASRRGGSGAEACYKQKSTRLQLTAVDRWGDTIGSRDTPLLVIPGSQTASYSSCKQQPARIPPAASVRAGQGGGLALRGEDAGLLGVPGSEAVLRDEGLLFHPRLRSQRAGHIVEIPYLVPLVGGEGDGFRGRSRQWDQPRLCHQRRFQLRRQLLPAFPRPAQDTQAGGPAQIVFAGRSVLQNLR